MYVLRAFATHLTWSQCDALGVLSVSHNTRAQRTRACPRATGRRRDLCVELWPYSAGIRESLQLRSGVLASARQEKHHLWFYRGLTVVEEVLLDARDVYWRHTLIMCIEPERA